MTQTKVETNTPNPVQEKKAELNVVQSVVSGSVCGATEVLVDHPLWTMKTRIQQGKPFTFNPQILYCGILPNAASMVPITALQVGLNRSFQQVFFGTQYELTDSQRLMAAFAAGAGSAVMSCPTEMIMTHQKTNFYSAATELVKQGGWARLYAGFYATMLREGMFTTFFLGVTPQLKKKVQNYCPHDWVSSIIAGMMAGVGATAASQGFDTVKTIQQAASSSESQNMRGTMQKLYSSDGVYGFFKGVIPRAARVISAVTIMGLVGEEMKKAFTEKPEEAVLPIKINP